MRKLFGARSRLLVLSTLGLAIFLGVAGAIVASAQTNTNDYVRGVVYVSATSTSQRTNYHYVVAGCPTGKNAIGGGVNIDQYVSGSYALLMSEPKPHASGTPDLPGGWEGAAGGPNRSGWNIDVWAVCADIHGAPPSTSGDSSGASSGSSGQSSSGSSGSSSGNGTSSGSSGSSGTSGQSSSGNGSSSSGSSGQSSSGTGSSGGASSGSSGDQSSSGSSGSSGTSGTSGNCSSSGAGSSSSSGAGSSSGSSGTSGTSGTSGC